MSERLIPLARGTALRGPHGEIAEYLGPGSYLCTPGARIRRHSGPVIVPASHVGSEWIPVPGRVVTIEIATGRWTSPVETYLGLAESEVTS